MSDRNELNTNEPGKLDDKAFTEIFASCREDVFRYALHMTKDEKEAQDLTQDVFLKLYEKRASVRNLSKILAFLLKMTRNRYLNKRKKETYEEEERKLYAMILQKDTWPGESPQEEEDQKIRQIFKGLESISSPACRAAFELKYICSLSHKQVATVMNIQSNTASNQVSHAKRIIKKNLKK